MADEMEQIEARLAAYVDGTLPPEQRAEIEAYLAANPTHGRLITELKSIKAAVMALPKEKAPAEILDTLQGHLERHTLLEGVEESIGASRIQRWPQVGALAAVLLLTAGLGILVYQVLPQKKGAAPELALLPESTQDTPPDDAPAAGQAIGGGVNFSDAINGPATEPLRADAARRDARPLVPGEGAPGQQMYQNQFGANQQDAVNRFAIPDLRLEPVPQSAPATFPVPSEALDGPTRVLTITTDDPVITRALIASYFAQHQLAFERLAEARAKTSTASVGALIGASADAVAAETSINSAAEMQRVGAPPALTFTPPTSAPRVVPPPGAGLASDPNQPKPAQPEMAAASTPAGESIVLRHLSPAQLADVETNLMQQRSARQQAIATWRHDVLAATTAPTTRPPPRPPRRASPFRTPWRSAAPPRPNRPPPPPRPSPGPHRSLRPT